MRSGSHSFCTEYVVGSCALWNWFVSLIHVCECISVCYLFLTHINAECCNDVRKDSVRVTFDGECREHIEHFVFDFWHYLTLQKKELEPKLLKNGRH